MSDDIQFVPDQVLAQSSGHRWTQKHPCDQIANEPRGFEKIGNAPSCITEQKEQSDVCEWIDHIEKRKERRQITLRNDGFAEGLWSQSSGQSWDKKSTFPDSFRDIGQNVEPHADIPVSGAGDNHLGHQEHMVYSITRPTGICPLILLKSLHLQPGQT